MKIKKKHLVRFLKSDFFPFYTGFFIFFFTLSLTEEVARFFSTSENSFLITIILGIFSISFYICFLILYRHNNGKWWIFINLILTLFPSFLFTFIIHNSMGYFLFKEEYIYSINCVLYSIFIWTISYLGGIFISEMYKEWEERANKLDEINSKMEKVLDLKDLNEKFKEMGEKLEEEFEKHKEFLNDYINIKKGLKKE